ncbi:Aste57867_11516 [Aphanomyces stellatus]|uniref:Aste57867_11516 protein n=1 Tax=Aphanomyces stellatus TaxID=120398 RepID=A0A485KTQ7_9STRA|nr:hypothetical protein As57867_011473 [Aphanomyces stellatus]VFT88377.1 Aste57867_11516 [Aphanomyces stellatus]
MEGSFLNVGAMLKHLVANPAPSAAVLAGALALLAYTSSTSTDNTTNVVPPTYIAIDHDDVQPNHGPVYRVGTVPTPAHPSMLHALQAAVEDDGERNFLGHRTYDNDGNALAYVWETYAQVYQRIENLAKGLAHEKMLETTADGDRPLCLYMKNRPEWVMGQYAAILCGGFGVALYDTLGENSTQFILTQTLAPTVLCTTAELANILALKPTTPTLQHVILVDVDVPSQALLAQAASLGLNLTTMTQVEAIGGRDDVCGLIGHFVAPALKDVYVMLYTSGTTGTPKGVPITHEMVLMAIAGVKERMCVGKGEAAFTKDAVHLSYLPLAHCIEHLLNSIIITAHGSMAYYQGNPLKLIEDLATVRPTLFVSVPRLLNKIYDKVVNGARAAGGVKAWLFDRALTTKLSNLKRGYRHHKVYDALIFSKIRTKLGLDRVGWFVSGGAPLSTDVMDFYRILLDCPASEGYGLTETTGGGAIDFHARTEAGAVGPPLICTEMKLVSVPEMGYNVTDLTHGEDDATRIPVYGRGELCIRGPNVFSGYYKAPELSNDVLDDDGWFHTGDIAVWTTEGCVKIVDRKKAIFKLSQGEYVSAEKIENALITSPYVAQIFVHGDSLHSVLVAIVVPEEATLMELAKSIGVSGSFTDTCANKEVADTLLAHLDMLGKMKKLYGFERVKAIQLVTTPLSVETNTLTPTFKLKRAEAKAVFSREIGGLYEQCGDVVAGHQVQAA